MFHLIELRNVCYRLNVDTGEVHRIEGNKLIPLAEKTDTLTRRKGPNARVSRNTRRPRRRRA